MYEQKKIFSGYVENENESDMVYVMWKASSENINVESKWKDMYYVIYVNGDRWQI